MFVVFGGLLTHSLTHALTQTERRLALYLLQRLEDDDDDDDKISHELVADWFLKYILLLERSKQASKS